MSAEKIKAALEKLDFQNDSQWTEDGLPLMDMLKKSTGIFGLTREQVNMAWPGFSRAALQSAGQAPSAPASPVSAPASAPADASATQVAAQAPTPPAAAPAVPNSTQADPEGDDSDVKGDQGDGSEVLQAEPQSEIDELRQKLVAAQEQLELARGRKKEADQEFAQANAAVDDILAQSETLSGEEPLAVTLNGYFAAQAKLRQIKLQQMDALKGIDLKAIFPTRAPIDMAMSRKTSRGTKRPGT